jgi:hypothetical protein
MKDIPLARASPASRWSRSRHRLIKVTELRHILRVDRAEFALAVTTALTVIFWASSRVWPSR